MSYCTWYGTSCILLLRFKVTFWSEGGKLSHLSTNPMPPAGGCSLLHCSPERDPGPALLRAVTGTTIDQDRRFSPRSPGDPARAKGERASPSRGFQLWSGRRGPD